MGTRLGLVLVVMLGSAVALPAVENDDLRRYGFSREVANTVDASRRYEVPAARIPDGVPSPVIPGDLLDPREIPEAPEFTARVIRQRQEVPTPGQEGPVSVYPGTEKATAEEGTFREVEDFFLRPSRIFDRVLSMNETGVTGLINMPIAEIPRPGSTHARAGFAYTFHDRFAGTNLPDSQAIETFTAPFTYQSVPWRNLELSLQVMGVSEDAENFPLVADYEVAGIREVGLNAKYRFYENPVNGIQAAFGFGMKVGVERVATRLGSNAVDYSMYLVGSKRMKNFGVHLRGGLTFPNGETRTNSGVPDITQVDLGLDFSPSDRLSITGELGYTDWNFVGTNTEATLGIKYKMSETWVLDFGVPLQLENNLAEGYRYRVMAAIQAQL